jgi:phosphatidylinositol glycan class S
VRSSILFTAAPDAFPPPPAGIPAYDSKQVCEALGDAVIKSTDAYYKQGGRLGTRWWNMVYEAEGRECRPSLESP